MLNYAVTNSGAITRYHASGIILHIHIDASFLSEPESNSRAGGYHYLITASTYSNNSPLNQPPLNGPVSVEFVTMRNVLASAMEEELGALF